MSVIYDYIYPLPDTYIGKTTHNLNYLKSQMSVNLNCPKGNIHLKRSIILNNKKDSWSAELHKLFNLNVCSDYNRISKKSSITAYQVMTEVQKGLDLINAELKNATKPLLLVIGENHLSQESFLIETLILTYLKSQNLSSSFLIERAPNYDQNTPISSLGDINPIHFAQHVLGFNLIGIDPLNENFRYSAFSPQREEKMVKSINAQLHKSKDKVTVVAVGYLHLPMFDQFSFIKNNAALLRINTAKTVDSVRALSRFEKDVDSLDEIYKKLDSIYTLELNVNIESMTFGQILAIYQNCLEENLNENDMVYSAYGLQKCGARITDDQVYFCGVTDEYV